MLDRPLLLQHGSYPEDDNNKPAAGVRRPQLAPPLSPTDQYRRRRRRLLQQHHQHQRRTSLLYFPEVEYFPDSSSSNSVVVIGGPRILTALCALVAGLVWIAGLLFFSVHWEEHVATGDASLLHRRVLENSFHNYLLPSHTQHALQLWPNEHSHPTLLPYLVECNPRSSTSNTKCATASAASTTTTKALGGQMTDTRRHWRTMQSMMIGGEQQEDHAAADEQDEEDVVSNVWVVRIPGQFGKLLEHFVQETIHRVEETADSKDEAAQPVSMSFFRRRPQDDTSKKIPVIRAVNFPLLLEALDLVLLVVDHQPKPPSATTISDSAREDKPPSAPATTTDSSRSNAENDDNLPPLRPVPSLTPTIPPPVTWKDLEHVVRWLVQWHMELLPLVQMQPSMNLHLDSTLLHPGRNEAQILHFLWGYNKNTENSNNISNHHYHLHRGLKVKNSPDAASGHTSFQIPIVDRDSMTQQALRRMDECAVLLQGVLAVAAAAAADHEGDGYNDDDAGDPQLPHDPAQALEDIIVEEMDPYVDDDSSDGDHWHHHHSSQRRYLRHLGRASARTRGKRRLSHPAPPPVGSLLDQVRALLQDTEEEVCTRYEHLCPLVQETNL